MQANFSDRINAFKEKIEIKQLKQIFRKVKTSEKII